jgi:hypothetical protein
MTLEPSNWYFITSSFIFKRDMFHIRTEMMILIQVCIYCFYLTYIDRRAKGKPYFTIPNGGDVNGFNVKAILYGKCIILEFKCDATQEQQPSTMYFLVWREY